MLKCYQTCSLRFTNLIFENNFVRCASLDLQVNVNFLRFASIFKFFNINMFASLRKNIIIEAFNRFASLRFASISKPLKGHGNEPDFPTFLHKPVQHGSLTIPIEPFRFWLGILGDIPN